MATPAWSSRAAASTAGVTTSTARSATVMQNDPVQKPTAVEGITSAVQVATGDDHTCALLAGGTVECWGAGFHGELGNGDRPRLGGAGDGHRDHHRDADQRGRRPQLRAARRRQRQLLGAERRGRSIRERASRDSAVPVPAGVANAIQVTSGTLARLRAARERRRRLLGRRRRWRARQRPLADLLAPVEALLAEPVTQLSAGDRQTCALFADHTVGCWGANVLAASTEARTCRCRCPGSRARSGSARAGSRVRRTPRRRRSSAGATARRAAWQRLPGRDDRLR